MTDSDAMVQHRHHLAQMVEGRRGDWIATATGQPFFPLDPRPEEVDMVAIVQALAHQCRWSGHTIKFYSVLEHSIHVARLVAQWNGSYEEVMSALMHDASEAYLVDVPRPIKHDMMMTGYCAAECAVQRVIMARFDLPYPIPELVKKADTEILGYEAEGLMLNNSLLQHYFIPADQKDYNWYPFEVSPEEVRRMWYDEWFWHREGRRYLP